VLPNWRLPEWFQLYKSQILGNLLDTETILEYALFHDCGKPFCQETDSEGRIHFPNHAEISAQIWLDHGGDEQIANLIRLDMDIHRLKAEQIEEFCKRKEAITLLIAGLAEIHSNANMFGGIDSDSFKIKWKHIDRRGKAICKIIFNNLLEKEDK